MRKTSCLYSLGGAAAVLLAASAAEPQQPQRKVDVLKLACAGGGCLLLQGATQTAGMRSGLVRLKSNETVGWHTTCDHEESLIILEGQGKALIEGQQGQPFVAPALVYIPPSTRHNVENTGKETLVYVYVVAPVKSK